MRKLILTSLLTLLALPVVAMEPISVGGANVVDVPAGSADSVRFDIQKGRFAEQSVDKLSLTATGIDFKQGKLQGLLADMTNAQFDALTLDAMKLTTGAFAFDPMELMNRRRFMLSQPVSGQVQIKLSEAHLNQYFSHPHTLEKLEKAANKKLGNVGLIKLSNPNLALLGKNKLKANLTVSLGGAVGTPVELLGNLGVHQGKIMLTDVNMTSNGTALPFDLATVFTSKFNEAIDLEKLGKKTFVVSVNKLNTVGKVLDLTGQVRLTKLEFGGHKS
jgi:LmeA-like phospholipid-binding